MNSLPIIASPVSAPWIPWVLLLLLVLLIVNLVMDGANILNLRKLFTMPERAYSENTNRVLTSITLSLFRVGTLALAVYVCCWKGQSMHMATYLIIVGIIYAIIIVRELVIWLLYVIFRFAPKREVVSKRYAQFATLTAMMMFVTLLVETNLSTPATPYILMGLAGLFLVCVLQMLVRVYTCKLLSIAYIAMFFVVLELLPLVLLVESSMYIIES